LVRGDHLENAVRQLKRQPGKGLFVGGVKLPLALAELGLIDEYEFVLHPRLAGHGPTLFAGLSKHVDLKLVSPAGVRLRARLEIQTASFFRAILRIRRKARANWSHASEDSIVASKSFDRRRARLIQPRVLSTTHLLGKTMKPLTVVSVRLTTVMVIRLAS